MSNPNDVVFKREKEGYTTNLSPVKEYFKQMSSYLMSRYNMTHDEAIKHVKKSIASKKPRNPIVKYRYQTEVGDVEIREDKLTTYLKDLQADNEILVPSFTTYVHPSKKKSIHAEFLSINIAKRKIDKKLAFSYKQKGDDDKSTYHNVMQKSRKIDNNSLSGAYASGSTALANPSAHYTLTSITRSVASIGNAVSEAIVAGNMQFREPTIAYNYITSIVANSKINDLDYVIQKYKLALPSAEDVLAMINYSSKYYWVDEVVNADLLDYLKKLKPQYRAAIMYTNNLWFMKEHNPELIKVMLSELSKKVTDGSSDELHDINTAGEGVVNLAHHIWLDELSGMDVVYGKMIGTRLLTGLASTTKHLSNTLQYYSKLIRTFFATDIAPPTIATIKDMMRDCIVLSDTDSTCGSYDKWVQWFYGKTVFSNESYALAAAVMTINTQVIDHYLKLFAKNMNIDWASVELIKMKNEFFWPVFIPANVSKHYYAGVLTQEGNVFKHAELELKGVHFIASNADQNIVKVIHQDIEDILAKITNNEKISLAEYVNKIADMELKLIDKIHAGDTSVYKKMKIKDKGSYKLAPDKSTYINHTLWEDVFADKYGSPGEPTYMVIAVPLTTVSKKTMNDYVATIKDTHVRDKLVKFMNTYKKEYLGVFRPPINVVGTKGIPAEITGAIDYRRIVTDNLNSAYIVLETLGFYRKPGMLISEMGYGNKNKGNENE